MEEKQKRLVSNDQPTLPSGANSPPGSHVVVGNFGQSNSATPIVEPQQAQAGADPYAGLTGSRMQMEKPRLPVGIYLIVALLFIGIIGSFFDSSQVSLLYTISLAVNLALGVGLLFRFEAARKILVVLSGVLLILYTIALVLTIGVQHRANQSVANYNAVVSQIDEEQLTQSQKEQLAMWERQIADAHEKVGEAFTLTYIRTGAYIVLMLTIVIYLVRPKVKEVFAEHV